jgi:hypothetical protein
MRAFASAATSGLWVVLVNQHEVVEDVLLVHQHLAHAVVDNHGHLARERRVVRLAVGNRRRNDVARAVLVLPT